MVIVPILGLGITGTEINAPRIRPSNPSKGIEVSQRTSLVSDPTHDRLSGIQLILLQLEALYHYAGLETQAGKNLVGRKKFRLC